MGETEDTTVSSFMKMLLPWKSHFCIVTKPTRGTAAGKSSSARHCLALQLHHLSSAHKTRFSPSQEGNFLSESLFRLPLSLRLRLCPPQTEGDSIYLIQARQRRRNVMRLIFSEHHFCSLANVQPPVGLVYTEPLLS